jgi:glutamate formiminotransferase
VVNVSEGRDLSTLSAIAGAAEDHLLDLHCDPDHNRSVLTLAGPDTEDAVRSVAARTVELVDLRTHLGVHPRLGALDVVPFVPLALVGGRVEDGEMEEAIEARNRFARWASSELALPCFLYGPERSLPFVRRHAFDDLTPDLGATTQHVTAGACAVGARHLLVAYNLWLSTPEVSVARAIASEIRGPSVRALGLEAGGVTQVSCNLVEPLTFGPQDAYDAVEALAKGTGTSVVRAELVGLAPDAVVEGVPANRRSGLDLDEDRTIEARLSAHTTPV